MKSTLVAVLSIATSLSALADSPVVTLGSGVLRVQARNVVLPEYPLGSIEAHHHGTAVVEVHVSTAGKVSALRVLESPDNFIKISVESAIRKWTFTPVTLEDSSRTPVEVVGRLIFQFRNDSERPVVIDLVDLANKRAQRPTKVEDR